MLSPGPGVAAVLVAGAGAQLVVGDAPVASTVFWLRALHWAVSVASLLYPLIFDGASDGAFLLAWAGVLASWAACDNACVLSLAEARAGPPADPSMFELPTPWPAFAVLALVAARFAWTRGLACADAVSLLAALGTYIAVHAMVAAAGERRRRRGVT